MVRGPLNTKPWSFDYPFVGRYLDLGGYRMHYLDEGSGETVLMLHGNPTWSYFYRHLIKTLRRRYRCLVPDHIGMGLSDKPSEYEYDYTLSSRVEDLEAFIERVAPKGPITLIVHDWGGMIGMAWATRNPNRIARIIAMNTACFQMPQESKLPWLLKIAKSNFGNYLIRSTNAFARVASFQCAVKRPLTRQTRLAYTAPYSSWKERVATSKFVQDIPLSKSDKAWNIVEATERNLRLLQHVPVFLAWGMKDWVFDHHYLDGWINRFPKASVKKYVDCGHYLLDEAPDLPDLIFQFLSSHTITMLYE